MSAVFGALVGALLVAPFLSRINDHARRMGERTANREHQRWLRARAEKMISDRRAALAHAELYGGQEAVAAFFAAEECALVEAGHEELIVEIRLAEMGVPPRDAST